MVSGWGRGEEVGRVSGRKLVSRVQRSWPGITIHGPPPGSQESGVQGLPTVLRVGFSLLLNLVPPRQPLGGQRAAGPGRGWHCLQERCPRPPAHSLPTARVMAATAQPTPRSLQPSPGRAGRADRRAQRELEGDSTPQRVYNLGGRGRGPLIPAVRPGQLTSLSEPQLPHLQMEPGTPPCLWPFATLLPSPSSRRRPGEGRQPPCREPGWHRAWGLCGWEPLALRAGSGGAPPAGAGSLGN